MNLKDVIQQLREGKTLITGVVAAIPDRPLRMTYAFQETTGPLQPILDEALIVQIDVEILSQRMVTKPRNRIVLLESTLSKTAQAAIAHLRTGETIQRTRQNGERRPAYYHDAEGRHQLSKVVFRTLYPLIDRTDDRIEAAGYVRREIFMLREDYR